MISYLLRKEFSQKISVWRQFVRNIDPHIELGKDAVEEEENHGGNMCILCEIPVTWLDVGELYASNVHFLPSILQ